MLQQQIRDLFVAASIGPGQRCSPWRVLRQIRLRPAIQKQLGHGELSELRRPTERCGTNVFISDMKIRAMIEKYLGLFCVSGAREFVQWSDAEPIRCVRIHS